MADENKIFIEKTVNQEVKIAFNPEELAILSKSFDLVELDRQANLSDESIIEYAKNRLDDFNNTKNEWGRFFYYSIFNHNDDAEVKIEKLKQYYFDKRQKIRLLRDKVLNSRVSKYNFGLEDIK